jgi:DAK2 domain fusion protein YloV
MLPVLKQAGVVDAGGEGFLTIIRGWINALEGKSSGLALQDIVQDITGGKPMSVSEIKGITGVDSLEYPYCTEFLVKGQSMDPDFIRQELTGRGDCLLVVGTDSIVKIHIHTSNPGKILDYALKYGSLHEVQIHNMLAQNEAASHQAKGEDQGDFGDAVNVSSSVSEDNVIKPEDFKEYGIVAVAMGEGISEIFHSLGVEQVVFGGQTMNPSTYDLAEASKKIAARNIIILPNNGNIVMAAQQVDELLEDRKVHVIPTKSIPQGIAALLGYNPDLEPDENIDNMKKAITQVSSGEVTYAVRSSQFGDLEISEGDILGLVEDKITTTGKEILDVSKKVLEEMNWRDKDLVTIIYGKDMLEEDVEVLEYWLESEKPDIEVEIYAGQQPLYYYIFGVE